MTIQPYPDDPHACLSAAERDIERYVSLLEGDGLTDGDLATAAHYIRVAARARRLAREQIANDAAGVTLHSTARDGKTVENTDAATKPARPPMGAHVGSDGGGAPSRINVTGTIRGPNAAERGKGSSVGKPSTR